MTLTKTEITENNKLIAEFMGFVQYEIKGKSNGYKVVLKQGFVPVETCPASLQFHNSWDWLMPVIDKIELLGFRWEIMSQPSNEREGEHFTHAEFGNVTYSAADIESDVWANTNSKLKAAYDAVIKFIKWHNSKV